ncbi:hypothetical protein BDF19DRAFT_437135 [Syncephalis fuscata]|nr:hypothetical protein BDF19DRAFT_437135 [Syncephalis fuscata]
MTISRPRSMFSWCFMLMGYGLNCRMLIWSAGFFTSLGMIFNMDYLCWHSPYIAANGYTFILIYYSFFTLKAKLGCEVYYPLFFLVLDWSECTHQRFFSIIFCRVTFNQYRLFGSDAWKRLARDGIQTVCLALLTNLICCTLIISRFDNANRDILFPIDW